MDGEVEGGGGAWRGGGESSLGKIIHELFWELPILFF